MLVAFTKFLRRYVLRRKSAERLPSVETTAPGDNRLDALEGFYQDGLGEISKHIESRNWDRLLEAFEMYRPPRAMLLMMSPTHAPNLITETPMLQFLSSFEYMLRKALALVEHGLNQIDGEEERRRLEGYRKHLLKLIYCHCPEMERVEQRKLADLIARDGDSNPFWLQFCCARVQDVGRLSDQFLRDYGTHFNPDAPQASGRPDDLALKSRNALLLLANTQAAVTADKRFAASRLNLARMASRDRFSVAPAESPAGDGAVPAYVEWLIETAVDLGATTSAEDSLATAWAKFVRKDYTGVIRILGSAAEMDSAQQMKCRRLVALSHGHLWKRDPDRRDVYFAVEELSGLESAGALDADDRFLFCELLAAIGQDRRAMEIFPKIDLDRVSELPEAVADLACRLNQLPAIDTYLRRAVDRNPSSVQLLSFFCQHLRTNLADIGASEDIMTKIEVLDPDHPWALIARCNSKLGKRTFEDIPNLLPVESSQRSCWNVEKKLIGARLSLARGDIEAAREWAVEFADHTRVDIRYVRSLLLAHQKEYDKALAALPEGAVDGLLAKSINELKAKLLLALRRHDEALRAAAALPTERQREVLPWIHMDAGNHSEAIRLTRGSKDLSDSLAFAIASENAERFDDALGGYERFCSNAKRSHRMFSFATRRYAAAAVRAQDDRRAGEILKTPALRESLDDDAILALMETKRDWDSILDRIKTPRSEKETRSLCHALSQKINAGIEKRQWEQARAAIDRLRAHDPEEADRLEALRAQMHWYDILKSNALPVAGEIPESMRNGPIGLHVCLNALLAGDIDLDAFRNRLLDAGLLTPANPKIGLLMLILAVITGRGTDGLGRSDFEGLLKSLDPDRRPVAQAFAMLGGMLPPDWQTLVERMDDLRRGLPVRWEDFCTALAQLAAFTSPARPDIAVKLLEKANIRSGDIVTAVYAEKAKESFKSGAALAALENLERAISS